MFDFVDMHLYEGDGYTLREEQYFIASPDGVFHAFTPSVALTYGDIEKYVKNGQVYVKNRWTIEWYIINFELGTLSYMQHAGKQWK